MTDLMPLAWPAARLGEALEALARAASLAPRAVEHQSPPEGFFAHSDEALSRWLTAAAGHLGLEAEPTQTPYSGVERLLSQADPTLLRLPGDGAPGFLALLGGGRRMVSVLGPDLMIPRLRSTVVRAALRRDLEAPVAPEGDRLLMEAGVPTRRQARARTAILRERLGPRSIGHGWQLCLPPGASFWQQARQARLPSRLVALLGGYAGHYVLWLLAWWMIGRGALQGRLDAGWLLAWALLLVTQVPCRLLATWAQGRLAIGAGGLLKQRLLAGALRLEPEEIRH
jgi:ATP-binding cassette, subfamily B, bacterial